MEETRSQLVLGGIEESSNNHRQIKRVEDARLLRGVGEYTDDIQPRNVAYLGLIRSPYAHALIRKIDFSRIKGDPQLISYMTGEDLVKLNLGPLYQDPSLRPTRRYQLAVGKVKYVGEPVAVVVVQNKYDVEDIVEKVEVEYEPLPPIKNIEESKVGTNLIYDDWKDNIASSLKKEKGNADAAIKSAPFVITSHTGVARQAGTPIEPRVVIASYDKSADTFDIHSSVQSAHRFREYLSEELRVPKERIQFRVSDVGGGFGTKGGQSYPEDSLACILAKATGYTIKWTSSRTEDFLETAPGRDSYCKIILACDSNARIVALKASAEMDVGVFGSFNNMIINTIMLMPGIYKIPNMDIEGRCYVTNKAPNGPVRGAGRPEASLAIERTIDMMAHKISIDPIEFRKINMIQQSEFPYESGTGYVYDSGNFPSLLETLLHVSEYEGLRKWRDELRKNGSVSSILPGLGVSLVIEDTGKMTRETAEIVASADGSITIYTGSSPHGQGHETTFSQLAANELGVPMEQIHVVWGDTTKIPLGFGTFGSRSAVTGGGAVIDACRKLIAIVMEKVSGWTDIEARELSFLNGSVVQNQGKRLPPRELATLSDVLARSGGIQVSSDFALKSIPFASSGHLCAVTVDQETGKTTIKKYVAIDDCGTIINEDIVKGQMQGGIAHGIGEALLEELRYDEQNQPLNPSFLDYTVPSALDVPDLEVGHIVTSSPYSLNGSKGVGESGTVGSLPAVLNAINDALRPLDIIVNLAPVTPEMILSAIRTAENKKG